MSDPEGLDVRAVTAWLAARIEELEPPLSFQRVVGGRSNLTYLVTDAGGRHWVVRRPPLHGVLPSAHDMGREHTVMAALGPTPVPVPAMIGYEPDPSVTGAEFFAMEYVEGAVLRDGETAERALDPPGRRTASISLIEVLARLHAVDPDAVGLGDFAPKQDYLDRQIRRWKRQLEDGRDRYGARTLPVLDEIHARLAGAVPDQQGVSVVHGDYRLDNLILGPEGEVRAILDWELCTLGDPMADVGMLAVYWTDPGEDPVLPSLGAPTTPEGFLPRADLIARYGERSGRDLSEIDYYMAFASWKVAIILEGVYARHASGAYGEAAGEDWRSYGDAVLELADRALEATVRAGR